MGNKLPSQPSLETLCEDPHQPTHLSLLKTPKDDLSAEDTHTLKDTQRHSKTVRFSSPLKTLSTAEDTQRHYLQ